MQCSNDPGEIMVMYRDERKNVETNSWKKKNIYQIKLFWFIILVPVKSYDYVVSCSQYKNWI